MENSEPHEPLPPSFAPQRRAENKIVSDLANEGKLVGSEATTKSALAFLLTRPLSKRMVRLVARQAGIITEDESEEGVDRFPDIFNGQQ
jgi:hypothetical protein